MATIIFGVLPVWQKKKLSHDIGDRANILIHQRGYKTNLAICYNPIAKIILLKYY